jgi:hypothetical protein
VNDGVRKTSKMSSFMYALASEERRNAELCGEIPYTFVVATRTIRQREEVLITYGSDFWDFHGDC